MKITDLIGEIFWSLTANKIRTFLTTLGIIIGIGSVIAMISVGEGAKANIEKSIQSAGSNLIYVIPGTQRNIGGGLNLGRGTAQSLTLEDVDEINKDLSQMAFAIPQITQRMQIIAPGANTNSQVIGTSPEYIDTLNLEIDSGTFITINQYKSLSRVAVLGPVVATDLFGSKENALGKTIRIGKTAFKIIGITAPKGGTGFNNPDEYIYVPLTTLSQYLSGSNSNYISQIIVKVFDQKSISSVKDEITNILLVKHKIKDPSLADFSVYTQEDILNAASTVTNTFTMLLASIAGISLLVGGIGIMNMMLTTVTERTREIGLRKAIGAESKDINIQFLGEAVVITFLGGILGIIFGWLLSWLISVFGGIQTQISVFSIFLAFGISALIGVIFGYYPAARASRLNPIEALRYE